MDSPQVGTKQATGEAASSRILVILGAGASKTLGAEKDLPLMGEWATLLHQSIDEAVPGIADLIGLHEAMEGPEFEQALGDFLQWRQAFPLNRQFQLFGSKDPARRTADNYVNAWLQNNEERGVKVIEAIRHSLFETYGNSALDPLKCAKAYKALLGGFGPAPLAFATTNYDRAAEIALEQCGYANIHEGFVRRTHHDTPRFDSGDFGDWTGCDATRTTLLHLHGAVGWYLKDDQVFDVLGDRPYTSALGDPVFLPPDPFKDPFNDLRIGGIWRAFNELLDNATHVFVLGHSLHDPVLTSRLATASLYKSVLITGLEQPEPLPGQSVFRVIEFSPTMGSVSWLPGWVENGNAALDPT